MTTLDKTEVQALRAEIDQALSAIASKHGMKFALGTIRFDTNQMRCKLEGNKLSTVNVAHVPNATAGSTLPVTALNAFRNMGGDETKFYMIAAGAAKFVDYKPRNHKYPYIMQLRTGKRYKLSYLQVLLALRNEVK